jgi:hypothetical protein
MAGHLKHDYLRDSLSQIYKECISCKSRTQYTCIRCTYCYSCHRKMEKVELEKTVTANFTPLEKYNRTTTIVIEQPSAGQQQIMAMDVYGQQIEPICNYRTCNHKFSSHGHISRKCKCRHAFNYAAGISLLSK